MGKTQNNVDINNASKEYWENKILSDMSQTRLSYDFQNNIEYQIKRQEFNIDEKSNESILRMTNNKDMLIYSILVSVFSIEISRYTSQEEVIIGIPMYGDFNEEKVRNYDKVLPLISNIEKGTIIKDHIKNIHSSILEVYKNQFYSVRKIMRLLNLEELTNICIMYESVHDSKLIDKVVHSKEYDITIVFKNNNNKITGVINYNPERYRESTISGLVEHFKTLLSNTFESINSEINEIEMLSEEEKNKLLYDFNNTKADYPKDKTIQELFEEQVEKNPDKVALVFEEKEMSYRELNERSNQIARKLRKCGVKPNDFVGIIVESSFEMFVGIIAVLKAGGAYLPIDPKYPENRISYMLEDSNAKVLLTQSKFINDSNKPLKLSMELNDFIGTVINLEDSELYCENKSNFDIGQTLCNSNDLAYIIYTSGSTGKPKGVIVEHKSLVNLCYWHNNEFEVTEKDNATKYAGVGFDASAWEIFPYIIKGSEIHIIGDEIRLDVNKLNEYFEENNITISFLPTQMCEQFMEVENTSLRKLLTGGDKLKQYKKKNYHLVNNYGPTECTVVTTSFTVDKEYNNLPIGKPILNTTVYILDKNNNLAPIGVAGELCISGDGLARGYLNRPDLTDKGFVENPFVKGEKLYRTGDLARWLPDGNIEFLGRIDNQVQIRGFRVELGEIENQILKLSEIKETVVTIVDEDTEKAICAYLVKDSGLLGESLDQSLDISNIRDSLSKALPDYMIPSYFIELESLPVTLNGKVDRKLLPKPKESVLSIITYIAPRNEREEKLINIFKEILNIDGEIGIKANLFELGGHSLKATILASKIHREFGVKVPLADIFKFSTVEKLSEVIENSETSIYDSIEQVEKKEYYPMSSAQKRMYIINQIDRQTTTYNMPAILKLKGKLNKARLEKAFIGLIERHEALRTSFATVEDELVQKIKEISQVEFHMNYEDISRLDLHEEGKEKLLQEKVREFIKPFNLENDLLIRGGVIQVRENEHLLMVDMHHIISDGVSMTLIIEEYGKIFSGEELETLSLQYKDYAVWQNEIFKSGEIKNQEKYWLDKFQGEIPVLDLKTDYKRPSVQSYEGSSMRFIINEEITKGLRNITDKTGTTLYMVLLSAMNVLLQKHTGQEDIIIGSPIAGRPHNDLSNIVGMFVNTLAMRNKPKSNMKFREFLEEVKKNSLEAYDNQDIQFEELVEKLDIQRDMSRNPLFDVMFTLQNIGIDTTDIKLKGLEVSSYDSGKKVAKFDITVTAIEKDKEIALDFNYGTKLYKERTIARLGQHLKKILEEIIQNIDVEIKDIDPLSKKEREQILVEFNSAEAEYPQDKTIHEIFEERAEKNPDKVALVFGDKEMTYGELNKHSNIVARKLRESRVKPNDLVAIMLNRSFEMIIGIMGILKSGGGYVPIDPSYPEDRIQYMLKDSKAKILITNGNTKIKVTDDGILNEDEIQRTILERNKFDLQIINLNNIVDLEVKESHKNINTVDDSNLETINKPNDLAYIIYTSGSTGKPKGVMIEHKSVINTLYSLKDFYPVEENDSYLLKTAFTFDVSVTELFTWFIGNGKLVILEQGGEKDPNAIYDRIQKNNVTHINFAPSTLNMFLNVVFSNNLRKLDTLKYVMVAGEEFSTELAKKCEGIFGELDNISIENIYGPTETTIYATKFSMANMDDKVDVPIGQPINNVKTYILDSNNNILPIGVTGELCIAGKGLARGYLNRPELTEEKFITNPFNPEEKMYKSGDLVRWLTDGNIEFLGRIDHQVKIRGYRIELGEIESQLLKHRNIKEAIVVARTDHDGNRYLCGYVVGNKKDKELSVAELREHLGKELPKYMIPQYFMVIEEMPINTSGKVNRKALPKPQGNINTGVEYEVPRNKLEEGLAKAWCEVLAIEKVGINDNFFDLGGHSLKATVLISKIYKELNKKISLGELFKAPTIKQLSGVIESTVESPYSKIEKVEEREFYEVSSAQKRMYMLQQFDKESIAYNMPVVFELEGNVNKEKVEKTFKNLIERHEALRTYFETDEDRIVQKLLEDYEFTLVHNREERNIDDIINEFIKPFNLGQAPLFRAEFLENNHEKYLLIDTHHIISDGVSMGILIKEFKDIYNGKKLEPLKFQYKDFVAWQNKFLKSEEMRKQEEYWINRFRDKIPVLNLPYDYQRPTMQSFEGDILNFKINGKTTLKLKELVKETGATMHMALLSVFHIILSKYSGQDDIVIGIPIAGRPHADIQNIVGVFVNTLAMRNKSPGEKKYIDFLREVKENSLHAYENQSYQLETLVEKLEIRRDTSRNPLFDVMFDIVLENEAKVIDLKDFTLKNVDISNKISKVDISLSLLDLGDNLLGELEYCTKLFSEGFIQVFANYYMEALEKVVENPNIFIKDIIKSNQSTEHTEEIDMYSDDF